MTACLEARPPEGVKLLQDSSGGVVVVFDDAKTRNALSVEKIRFIKNLTSELVRKRPPWLLFRSALPTVFATGAHMGDLLDLDPQNAHDYALAGQGTWEAVAGAPYPTAAWVEGACRGGAFDLALACSFRFVGEKASFGHPGGAIGMLTGWSGTSRFPALAGLPLAFEAVLRGRTLCARELVQFGLATALKEGQLPPPFTQKG